jgi:hypothetical protein
MGVWGVQGTTSRLAALPAKDPCRRGETHPVTRCVCAATSYDILPLDLDRRMSCTRDGTAITVPLRRTCLNALCGAV